MWKCLKMVSKQGLLGCFKILFFGLWTLKSSWKPFTENVQRNRGLQIRIIDMETHRTKLYSRVYSSPISFFCLQLVGSWVKRKYKTRILASNDRRSLNSALFLARNCLTLLLGERRVWWDDLELESSIEIALFQNERFVEIRHVMSAAEVALALDGSQAWPLRHLGFSNTAAHLGIPFGVAFLCKSAIRNQLLRYTRMNPS